MSDAGRQGGSGQRVGLYNPPGLSQIRYRVGDYATFLDLMLALLQRVAPQPGKAPPLAHLNPNAEDEWATALVRVWAGFGDAFTFYQERLANEGYLGTAVEERSVIEMFRSVGVQAPAPVSAVTHVALSAGSLSRGLEALSRTLTRLGGIPIPAAGTRSSGGKGGGKGSGTAAGDDSPVPIAAGSSLQSLPAAGESPQTFEITESLSALPQVSQLYPRVPTRRVGQPVRGDTTELRLEGTATGIDLGQPVLIAGRPAQPTLPACYVRTVSAVEVVRKAGYTLVSWDEPLGDTELEPPPLLLSEAQLFAFAKSSSLFGASAPQWASQTVAVRRTYAPMRGGLLAGGPAGSGAAPSGGALLWRAADAGLPVADLPALLAAGDDLVAASQGQGVFVSADGGASWKAASSGLGDKTVLCLAGTPGGELLAGTVGGSVYRSSDGGATWSSVAGGPPKVVSGDKGGGSGGDAGTSGESMKIVSTSLPKSVVHAVAFTGGSGDLDPQVVAGTDQGIYFFAARSWAPARHAVAIGGAQPLEILTPVTAVTNALLLTADSATLLAATETGLLLSTDRGATWIAQDVGSSAQERLTSLATGSGLLVAGGAGGVWTASAAGGPWTQVGSLTAVTAVAVASDSAGGTVLLAGTDDGLFSIPSPVAAGADWENAGNREIFLTSGTYAASLDRGRVPTGLSEDFDRRGWPLVDPVRVTVETAGQRWRLQDARSSYLLSTTPGGTPVPPPIRVELLDAVGQVLALAAQPGSGGRPGPSLVSSPFDGFATDDWPGFEIEGRDVDLARTVKDLAAGGWLVLSQGDGATGDGPELGDRSYRVEATSTVYRDDFKISGRVSRLRVTPEDGLADYRLRDATAWVASQALSLWSEDVAGLAAVAGSEITLDRQLDVSMVDRGLMVVGKPLRAWLEIAGGVLRRGAGGWSRRALPGRDLDALAARLSGDLFAADEDGGVWRLPVDGVPRPARRGLPAAARVAALAAVGNDVWAGVEVAKASTAGAATGGSGLYLWQDGGGGSWVLTALAGDAVTALAAADAGASRGLLAGTASGTVYRVEASGRSTALGSVSGAVTALAADRAATWAASAHGVWRSTGGAFAAADAGLTNSDVSSLAFDAAGNPLAGTRGGGVFVYRNGSWSPLGSGLATTVVQGLLLAGGELLAATYGRGVVRLEEGLWRGTGSGISNDVQALVLDAAGDVVAAAANVSVLIGDDGLRSLEVSQLPAVELTLTVDDASSLDQGNVPDDLAQAASKQGVGLGTDTLVTVRRPGQTWWLESGGERYLTERRGDDRGVLFQQSAVPAVVAAPAAQIETALDPRREPGADPAAAPAAPWKLVYRDFTGSLVARPGEIFFLAAAADAAEESELALVVGQQPPLQAARVAVGEEQEPTRLALRRPLQGIYDAATVTLLGNVAPASHGRTVTQVLGSGDGSQANQRFKLTAQPLAFDGDDDGSFASSARVRVNGVAWTQVDSLLDSAGSDSVYALDRRGDGSVELIFGDGEHGARLPSGRDNVTVSYRVGGGPSGEIGAGRLVQLLDRPQRVRSVTNPAPAERPGSVDDSTAVRLRIPLTLRPLGRLVSLSDYADYAAASNGIAKAQAAQLWTDLGRRLALTVASVDGKPLAPGSDELESLERSIDELRSPGPDVQVLTYAPAFFQVAARIVATAGTPQDALPALCQQVAAALEKVFGFAGRTLAQPVAASEVLAVMQRVEGVAGVELCQLYRRGSRPGRSSLLPSRGAQWDAVAGQVLPAELLTLDTENGPRLDVEVAS